MRIISGTWRSRPLKTPEGAATRPTADRVRETLFSMLQSRLGSFEDLVILDLFAGSGALALEALSRGAAQAFLIEKAPDARKAIEANIRALAANARLMGYDATALPRAPRPADLIFLDPPYEAGLVAAALESASRQGWVAPATWIAAETGAKDILDVPGFTVDNSRPIGKARINLLRPV